MDGESDVAIQLFVQASILLSRKYNLDPITYADFRLRSERAGYKTIPFIVPDSLAATPELQVRLREAEGDALEEYLATKFGTKRLVKYYIRTGLRAAQLICRSHLTRLDEGNQYLEFIKREIGVASSFATGILALINTNATLTKSFAIAVTGVNDGLNAYQEYRYLSIDRDTARILVETAQMKLANFHLKQVDLADDPIAISAYENADKKTITYNESAGGYTFSDAINAVSVIEHQCTREGIHYLLNRSISNTPSNIDIDASTGTVMYKSAKENTKETDETPGTTAGSGGQKKAAAGNGSTPEGRLKRDPGLVTKWAANCNMPGNSFADGDPELRKALLQFIGKNTDQTSLTDDDIKKIKAKFADPNRDTNCTAVK